MPNFSSAHFHWHVWMTCREVSTGRLVLREPPLTDDELDCWKYQVSQKGSLS